MRPAASWPSTTGSFTRGWKPSTVSTSLKQTPAASTVSSTSPAPRVGGSLASPNSIVCLKDFSETAFMTGEGRQPSTFFARAAFLLGPAGAEQIGQSVIALVTRVFVNDLLI